MSGGVDEDKENEPTDVRMDGRRTDESTELELTMGRSPQKGE